MYNTTHIYNSDWNNIPITDVITNKNALIHKQMYNEALSSFLNTNPEYLKDEYIINEVIKESSSYKEPSNIIIINKDKLTKTYKSLREYWPDYLYDISKSININDFNMYEFEIIDKNYFKGTNILQNRYTGEIIELQFKDTPKEINRSEDFNYVNEETFTAKYKKLML